MSCDAPHVLFRRCLRRQADQDWQCFLALHGRRLRWLVGSECRSIGHRVDADGLDDLVQELYVSLLTRSDFDGHSEAALWAYLRVSVRHQLIDHLRKASARKRSPSRRESVRGWASGADHQSGAPASSSPPPPPPWAPARCTEPRVFQRLLQRDLRRWLVIRCQQAFLVEAEARGQPVDVSRRRLLFAAIGLTLIVGFTSREASRHLGGQLPPGEIDRMVSRLRKQVALEGVELPRR